MLNGKAYCTLTYCFELTIIIENGDFHDASFSQSDEFTFGSGDQGQLDEELLIRLPLVVVDNCNSDLNKKKYHFSFKFEFY